MGKHKIVKTISVMALVVSSSIVMVSYSFAAEKCREVCDEKGNCWTECYEENTSTGVRG